MSRPSSRKEAGPLWGVKTLYNDLGDGTNTKFPRRIERAYRRAARTAESVYKSPFYNGPSSFELKLNRDFARLGFAAGMLVQDGVEVPEEDIKELTEVPESVHDLFETAAFIGAGPFRDRYYPFPSPTVDDGGPRAFYVGFSEARRLSSVGVH